MLVALRVQPRLDVAMLHNTSRTPVDAVLLAFVGVTFASSTARADQPGALPPAEPIVAAGTTATASDPDTTTVDIPTPEAVTPPPVARPTTHSAADVTGAPVPGDEHGRTDQIDPGDSALRVAGRVVLFLPKIAAEIVLSPLRGAVWADDRYLLIGRWYNLFWNKDLTIGLYPTASYETGLGIVGGARFVDKKLFGEHEQLVLQAAAGITYRQSHLVSLRSGSRFGDHLELGLDGNFDRLPSNPFYGIGNSDVVSAPAMPIDPRIDSTAVMTSHRYQEARVATQADVRVVSDAHAIARGALTDITVGPGMTGVPIDMVYAPTGLVGYDQGVTNLYGELELRWDTRFRPNFQDRDRKLRAGTLASVFAGRVDPLGNGAPSGFWHYGTELQQFVRLGGGPRVLVLRAHGEGVSGSLDTVPFVELPYLGGDSFLRGYTYQRFRDRVAAVGSAQYIWDLGKNVDGYLFVDAGRVYPSFADLTFSGMRVGYGLGLELHDNSTGFLMEASLASSIDGGVLVSLSFNPVLDARPRWR